MGLKQRGLYLSPTDDRDLLLLLEHIGGKNFAKAIKESMRCCIRPGYTSDFLKSLHPSPLWDDEAERKDAVRLSIAFSSQKDEDLRHLLESIKPNKMSGFMKQALRYALGPYYCLGLMLNSENDLVNSNENYISKELFFIETRVEVKYKDVVKEVATPTVKKVEVKPDKEIKEENKPVFKPQPTVSTPTFNPVPSPQIDVSVNVPINTSDDDFSDDDILSMLDNM